MKSDFRLRPGSVQSKAISLLTFASIAGLFAPNFTYAIDYPPSIPNSNVFTEQTAPVKVDQSSGGIYATSGSRYSARPQWIAARVSASVQQPKHRRWNSRLWMVYPYSIY